jgi:hypothetical protein
MPASTVELDEDAGGVGVVVLHPSVSIGAIVESNETNPLEIFMSEP